jgi:hypothetical protein
VLGQIGSSVDGSDLDKKKQKEESRLAGGKVGAGVALGSWCFPVKHSDVIEYIRLAHS